MIPNGSAEWSLKMPQSSPRSAGESPNPCGACGSQLPGSGFGIVRVAALLGLRAPWWDELGREGNAHTISSPETFVTYTHPQKKIDYFSRDLFLHPLGVCHVYHRNWLLSPAGDTFQGTGRATASLLPGTSRMHNGLGMVGYWNMTPDVKEQSSCHGRPWPSWPAKRPSAQIAQRFVPRNSCLHLRRDFHLTVSVPPGRSGGLNVDITVINRPPVITNITIDTWYLVIINHSQMGGSVLLAFISKSPNVRDSYGIPVIF